MRKRQALKHTVSRGHAVEPQSDRLPSGQVSDSRGEVMHDGVAQPAVSILAPAIAEAETLARELRQHGLRVERIATLKPPLHRLQAERPSAVLLAAPASAVARAAIRGVRRASTLPCLVLLPSPSHAIQHLVLEEGADAVLPSESPTHVIAARLRSVLRRAAWGRGWEDGRYEPVLATGWQLDLAERQLRRPDGTDPGLTHAEFELLRTLMTVRGSPVSRDALATVLGRPARGALQRSVDNLVVRLRRKLGDTEHRVIKTVRHAGYLFAGFAEEASAPSAEPAARPLSASAASGMPQPATSSFGLETWP